MTPAIFRGIKCKDGEWFYGYLVLSLRSWRGHKPHKCWLLDSPFSNGGWLSIMGRAAVIEETVGQWTGLKDENETMVFEGDIFVDDWGQKWEVKYCHDKACFSASNGSIEIALHRAWNNKCVVIGNIHENID